MSIMMTSLGTNYRNVSDLCANCFSVKAKTDVCGRISQEGIVRLRSGKKDSVPFSKYFKTDQVFETGSVPL